VIGAQWHSPQHYPSSIQHGTASSLRGIVNDTANSNPRTVTNRSEDSEQSSKANNNNQSVKLNGAAKHHVALPDVYAVHDGQIQQPAAGAIVQKESSADDATVLTTANKKEGEEEDKNNARPNKFPLAGEMQHHPKRKRMSDQISRGEIGLPMTQTPALVGAQPGHIQCDGVDADSLAYWNDPRGEFDVKFETPFKNSQAKKPQYITFEPDSGGWNNIRMSMEIIFVFAAATGRTLVLPPDQPLYLLKADSAKKQRGFGDFFALDHPAFKDKLEIITTEEFLKREGGPDGQFPIPDDETRESLMKIQGHCERRAKSNIACGPLWSFYEEESKAYIPEISDHGSCVIFGPRSQQEADISPHLQKIKDFCHRSKPTYYDKDMSSAQLIHFKTQQKGYRLVQHFYNIILFTDPVIDNFFKRFVRDFLHYRDPIFCAAAKIIQAIQKEAAELGFHPDEDGGGGYSALHVRRGDLQYKRVKIPAEEWRENTKDIWLDNEILYVATDERDKSFFDPLKYDADTGQEERHKLRFLDDYWDVANLADVDPNYFGMLDTIVASRGRAFAGTFYSTFSGYINRMRGYHGMSMKDSYYGFKPFYDEMHNWNTQWGIGTMGWAREFPTGWVGIDGDVMATADGFAY